MNALTKLSEFLNQTDNVTVNQVFFDLAEVINTNIEKNYSYVFWNLNSIKFTENIRANSRKFTIDVYIVGMNDNESKIEKWDDLHTEFVEYINYLESVKINYSFGFVKLNEIAGEYLDRGQVSIDDELGIKYTMELESYC